MTTLVGITAETSLRADEVFPHAVVACDHPAASRAGLEVLRNGGNVVDATVAASFALSVVRPASCGIGGGGFMVVWDVDEQRATALDYREVAPSRSTRDMFADQSDTNSSVRGGLAVAVPGTVAGLCYAAQHYGSLSLPQLLAPAIRLARDGVAVDEHDRTVQKYVLAAFDEHPLLVERFGELRRLYLNNGEAWQQGDRFHSPQLSVLQAISDHGPQAFYFGEIGDAIVDTITTYGGIIDGEDLTQYQPRVRETVRGTFHGLDIHSMPPPSSGGIALIQMLQTLEAWEHQSARTLASLGHNSSDYVHVVAEAMKHAFADRAEFLGDTDFVDVPVAELLSRQYASRTARGIDLKRTRHKAEYGRFFNRDDSGTSHVSVIDQHGNAAACTETINLTYGSFVVVPKFGIILNNEMDDFAARPGEPNAFGLLQSDANAVAPCKKPLSSMTPTIIVRDGRAILATGASGGPRIISASLQATLNHLLFGMTPTKAVSAMRFHHQWFPETLSLEVGFDGDLLQSLESRGHNIAASKGVGVTQTVVGSDAGVQGGSDPRKHGAPAGY